MYALGASLHDAGTRCPPRSETLCRKYKSPPARGPTYVGSAACIAMKRKKREGRQGKRTFELARLLHIHRFRCITFWHRAGNREITFRHRALRAVKNNAIDTYTSCIYD